jgi:hypothetical protein
MDIQTFVDKYTNPPNQFLKSRNGILGQCVSVPSLFFETNGWPELDGDTALDIYNDFRNPAYQVEANTPQGIPQPGDAIFFDSSYGAGDGHTASVISATLTTITAFEQDDPNGSPAHIKVYPYNNILGWLHPVGSQGGDMPLTAGQIDFLYRKAVGRPAMQSDIDGNIGKDPGSLISALQSAQETSDYDDELIYHAYLGYLRRPPEQQAVVNARQEGRRQYFNDVQKSPEAAQVTADYEAGKNGTPTTQPTQLQPGLYKV